MMLLGKWLFCSVVMFVIVMMPFSLLLNGLGVLPFTYTSTLAAPFIVAAALAWLLVKEET